MISALLLSAVLSCPVGSGIDEVIASPAPESCDQDKAERAKKLIAEGKKAEGYALIAEILNDRGDRAKAQQAYDKARSFGWTQPPPWGGDETPAPTTGPRPTPGPRETPTPAAPKRDRTPKRDKLGKIDAWPYFQFPPLK